MKNFFKSFIAEMLKQHKNYFHNKSIYISLFIWPFLSFVTAYYSFKSFDLDYSAVNYLNKNNILTYLILGFLCMSFFRCLVQSAWQFSFERQSGTLELIFLSPSNRLAILLGNAFSSLFEGAVSMSILGLIVILVNKSALNAKFLPCFVVCILGIIMATLWGLFLNSLFLFSRDSGILFTVLEEPMEIFSGVKTPVELFPFWAKIISFCFPLTYVIEASRNVFLLGYDLSMIKNFIIISICIIIILFIFSLVALKSAENHNRKNGNFILF